MTIRDLIHAQGCTRWHANPEIPAETLAEHHLSTGLVVLWLTGWRASTALLAAAMTHDLHEAVTGDTPAPAKRRWPALAALLDAIAAEAEADMGIPGFDLTADEAALLKLADGLAAILYARVHRPDLMKRDGWPEDVERVRRMAWRVSADVGAKVEGVL